MCNPQPSNSFYLLLIPSGAAGRTGLSSENEVMLLLLLSVELCLREEAHISSMHLEASSDTGGGSINVSSQTVYIAPPVSLVAEQQHFCTIKNKGGKNGQISFDRYNTVT